MNKLFLSSLAILLVLLNFDNPESPDFEYTFSHCIDTHSAELYGVGIGRGFEGEISLGIF